MSIFNALFGHGNRHMEIIVYFFFPISMIVFLLVRETFGKGLLVTGSRGQLSKSDSLTNTDLWFGRHCQTSILYLGF